MSAEKRIVLIEKFKKWDYVDSYGCKVWIDKYGEILKKQAITGEFFYGNYAKIKINWTIEMAQDLQALHGIDVEAELTAILSAEIDREILRTIMNPNTFAV